MASKRIINAEIGKGWHYFEGSGVSELIHSGAVVIETDELRFVYCSGRTAMKTLSSRLGTSRNRLVRFSGTLEKP
jgi:hypothetical protein